MMAEAGVETAAVMAVATATVIVVLQRQRAVLRDLITFTDRPLWKRLQENAMKADFSWDRSAQAYENLYFSALEKARTQS